MYKTNGIYVTHVYICLFCLSLLFFLFRKMYGIYVHTPTSVRIALHFQDGQEGKDASNKIQ